MLHLGHMLCPTQHYIYRRCLGNYTLSALRSFFHFLFIPLVNKYVFKPSYFFPSSPHSPPSPWLPSILLHASLIPFFAPPLPSSSLKRESEWQFMKSQTAWSIQTVPGEELQESVHLRCFGEKGWRKGWKSATGVVQTPPSSFHPSPPKASRVYLALSSASDF